MLGAMAEVDVAGRGTAGYVDPLRGLWTEPGAASSTDAVAQGRAQARGRFLHFVVPFHNIASNSRWASGIRGIQACAFQISNMNLTAWCGFTSDAGAQQGTVELRRGVVFGSPPTFTGWLHLWVQPGSGRATNLPASTAFPSLPFRRRTGLVVHGNAGLPSSLFSEGTSIANRDAHVHRVFFVPGFSSNDTTVLGVPAIEAVALQLASANHRASVRVASAAHSAEGRVSFRLGLGTVGSQPIAGWVHTWSRR